MKTAIASFLVAGTAGSFALAGALPNVKITEWQYAGIEFVEFTNLDAGPIDMTGWSYDDDSRLPGTVSLSAFGTLAPGASAILAEDTVATFTSLFPAGYLAGVPIIGSNTVNLGRSDEINLYNSGNTLIDRLTYSDVNIAGTPRTDVSSGNPSTLSAIGANDSAQWVLSSSGDVYGSVLSTRGGFANPGRFVIPEPATLTALVGAGLLALRRRA